MKPLFAIIAVGLLGTTATLAQETKLESSNKSPLRAVAHWPLAGDARDVSGQGRDAVMMGSIDWDVAGPTGQPRTAAGFDGQSAYLEVPAATVADGGTGDFTLSAWIRSDEAASDVPGDILSQYDPKTRRGFLLTLKTQSATNSQTNSRQLQFGIDDNRDSGWIDCGRPGAALFAFGMVSYQGALYAGTCEPGADQAGHVYRYGGGQNWIDCGAPDTSNAVTALAVHNGKLYVGTGRYRVSGSALPDSENQTTGGRIFRYAGEKNWILCGELPETIAIGGLIEFGGELYASSLYAPAGFYRYAGDQQWIDCGTPPGKRIVALGVYNGGLFGTSYDSGHVYRYDGQSWSDLGRVGDSTQLYSFASYEGRWYVANWPDGRVFRWAGGTDWEDVGQLGAEQEVMGMLVHNGRLLAGTLPLAEVYSYEGDNHWKLTGRLDHTPDVKYRRAWTMAEQGGRVYCSVLPSGKIFAYRAGQTVAHDHALSSGWNHVTATRDAGELKLFLNGKQVARSPTGTTPLDLTTTAPLRIGFGPNDHFHGAISDVRLYSRSLTPAEIEKLAERLE